MPGSTPMTFFDACRRIVLANPADILTPSGIALNPLTLAAATAAAKSLPALANSRSAAGFWIQPISALWSR